jgi:hypothetical protein
MSGSFKGGVLVPNDRSLRLIIDVAAAQYGIGCSAGTCAQNRMS